jgi:hypothetical protein
MVGVEQLASTVWFCVSRTCTLLHRVGSILLDRKHTGWQHRPAAEVGVCFTNQSSVDFASALDYHIMSKYY